MVFNTPQIGYQLDIDQGPSVASRTATLLSTSSLAIMAGAVVAPTLPVIRDRFAEQPNVEMLSRMILTVPPLAIAFCAPGAGWILDRFGRKLVLLIALALFAVAGSSAFFFDSLTHIVISRVLLGVAVAVTMTASTTLVGDFYAGHERTRLLGLQAASAAIVGVVLTLVAGSLAERSWRAPFLLYALALILIPFVVRSIDEPPTAAPASRSPGARIPLRAMAIPIIIYATMFSVQIAFYMIPVQVPFFLAEMGQTSPRLAGAALAAMTLSAAVVAASFRWIKPFLSRFTVVAISTTLLGSGLMIVSSATGYAQVIVAMVVAGTGMGFNYPNLVGWLIESTDPVVRGRVVGGVATFAFTGQFCSPIIARPFIERAGLGFAFEVAATAVLCGAGLFASTALYRRIKRR